MCSLFTRPIAHRGLHDHISPENSLSAINRAVEFNFPVEIDIHLSSDNKIFVFHDDNLKRMTGTDAFIKNLSSDDIKKLRLTGTNESIPSFKEVLSVINRRVPLLIEIKKGGNKKLTALVLSNVLKEYKGEYAVQSFYPDYLYAVKKLKPDIARGQLATCQFPDGVSCVKRFVSKNMLGNFLSNPDFISYDYTCLPVNIVSMYKKHGHPVLGYTVRSRDEEKAARKYCDNIIFEGYIPD